MKSMTAKDFRLEWYSGQGAGGQKKNRSKSYCRITHIETGIKTQCTRHKSPAANQKEAFTRLARMLVAHYKALEAPTRDINNETVRTYHTVRNVVKDHVSGHTQMYSEVENSLDEMIRKRKEALGTDV